MLLTEFLIEHEKSLAVKVTKSLFSSTYLLHKSKLCGLSTGRVLEGARMPEGDFMVCEGQIEQNAEEKPPCHPSLPIKVHYNVIKLKINAFY